MNYEQMSVFDFLPRELDTLPEADMVKMIGRTIGVEFKWDSFFEEYVAKIKGLRLTVEYENYFVDEYDDEGLGARFIGCGYDYKHSGGGAPKDSVNEAIEWFRGVMRRILGPEGRNA